MLYARTASLHALASIAHHFLKVDKLSYKLQPGGPGYEIVYSTTAILPYLLSLSAGSSGSATLETSFELIAAHEQTLVKPLLAFLTAPEQVERGVRVVGDEKAGNSRVPTISFIVTGQRPLKSKDIVGAFDAKGGVRILTPLRSHTPFLPQIYQSDWHSLWPLLRIYAHRQPFAQGGRG